MTYTIKKKTEEHFLNFTPFINAHPNLNIVLIDLKHHSIYTKIPLIFFILNCNIFINRHLKDLLSILI